ncbi:acyl-homoserine lactone acylase PvdQ [Bradyrhizobium sp. GM7.3]
MIAASRTATGRPILANDPHREHSVPSLRYIVGLNAPGLSVIGAGEPALPGISIGHNGTIAFGLTIFNVDQEDLYIYELNPQNPNQYRYGAGWEDMRIVHEKEQVKGESDRDLELKFTRHGPVIYVDDANKRAFAVRSIWFEPGTSAYFGSSDYMTAKDWNGFLGAMRRWGAPSENQVYADTKGNIGWVAAGKTPRRANYDGLMPVPGDGRYEWQGFLSLDELPKTYQPKQGFLATANQMNLPADYPVSERKVGFEWADSARWQRITEVLKANSKVTLADAMDLQNDDTTMLGRRLVKLLQPLTSDDANVKKGLELLKPWDARDAADNAAAAVFEVWISNHLGPVLLKTTAPKAADLIAPEASSISALVAFLESPDASFGSDPATARDQILRDSLGAAVADVTAKLGARFLNLALGPPARRKIRPCSDAAGRQGDGRSALGRSAGLRRRRQRAARGHLSPHRLSAVRWRIVPHGARRRQLGCEPHHQHTGPVGRSLQRPLSRPRAALGDRPVCAAALQPRRGRGCNGGGDHADAAVNEAYPEIPPSSRLSPGRPGMCCRRSASKGRIP